MFEFYTQIVNGTIKPHYIDQNNLDKVHKIFTTSEEDYLFTKDFITVCSKNYGVIDITEDEKKGKISITLIPDENLQQLININIPPPPDEKAEIYETLIKFEYELIKCKVNNFIKASNNIKDIELFANKNIHILKELAKDLRIYIKKLHGKHGNLFVTDSNHFISYVLKYYLIETIQYIQETLSTFIKIDIESEPRLLYELFHQSFPRVPEFEILALLPKEEEFQNFRNEFLKSKEDIEIGESLFRFYKKKNKDFEKEVQIDNYRKTIQFWNELLITNKLKTIIFDQYFNEPEIEQILIPLLQNEIDTLEAIKIPRINDSYKLKPPQLSKTIGQSLNTFESILPEPKASFVLEMLESLGLTVNGVSCISERKKGSILGTVEALRDENILPQQSIDSLCKLIANKINLSIGSKLYISEISMQYKTKATAYIKQYYNL